MSTAEILVVGSGPSGLILALSLARNGVPVRVIEKTKTHRIGQRGAGIQPRSLEIFDAFGIIDKVKKHAIPLLTMRMYKMPDGVEVLNEMQMVPKLDPNPTTPYLYAVLLGQDSLDKIIRAELEKYGVTVELGTELQSLTQFDDHVDVKILRHSLDENAASEPLVEEATYKWVVGADGGKGVVRKQLGLAFLGDTTEQKFVVGDIKLEGLSTDRWHLWGDLPHTITSIRPTDKPGLFWFLIGGSKMGEPAEVSASQDNVHAWLKKGTGKKSEDIKFGEVICMANYTINIRMVDTFQKGRVFLIGDAAHVHSPTGGQGLNTGVQDACNLAWKLALVAKGLAQPTLLESFNEERLPVVSEMLNITTTILKKTIANEGGWNRGGNLHQLGVNYRWSTIVVDEEVEASGVAQAKGSSYDVQAGFVHAGDRAPDAPGLVKVGGQSVEDSPVRLFQLLKPEGHTVLIFGDKVDHNSVLAELEKHPKDLVHPIVIVKAGEASSITGENIFEDRDGHAHEAYKGAKGTTGIFVIRPDGVVGCRAGSTQVVERYFQGVFGKSV